MFFSFSNYSEKNFIKQLDLYNFRCYYCDMDKQELLRNRLNLLTNTISGLAIQHDIDPSYLHRFRHGMRVGKKTEAKIEAMLESMYNKLTEGL